LLLADGGEERFHGFLDSLVLAGIGYPVALEVELRDVTSIILWWCAIECGDAPYVSFEAVG
jgi:hypothetical protein